MIKNAMEKNAAATATDREMAALKEHFPGCFHGDEFDLEAFARKIGKGTKVAREGYGLSFLGRDYGRLVAARETETVLVPDEAHNAKPENRDSRNLYITGDNLDALKHLLGSYAGAVKCIYIDPLYNTGSDEFVYKDSFSFTASELSEKLGVSEEEAARVLDLTRRSSASHSAWLLFLYPRLLLARDLLSKDGVIFISIDDNEQANLKLLCDEVFGEENFVANIPWQSRASIQNDTDFSINHEYILAYARHRRQTNRRLKEENVTEWKKRDTFVCRPLPLDASKFENPDNDPRGPWKADPFDAPHVRANLTYPIINPKTGEQHLPPRGRCWRMEQPRFASALADKRIYWGADGRGRPALKVFYEEKKEFGSIDNSWFSSDRIGTTTNGTKEQQTLFDGVAYFDTPKPVSLLTKLLTLANLEEDSLICDFFSGSATTAEAVMRMNTEDAGNRHFILVQLDEPCKDGSEAQRAGYRTIDEIGRARIEKAAAKIREESPLFHGDLGFRHYRLATPSKESVAKMWDFKPDSLVENTSLLEEFGEATVLATWLAHDGYGLSEAPAEVDFAGYKGHFIGRHLYFTRTGLTDEAVLALCEKIETDPAFNPENLVLFGYSFSWSALEHLRINLARAKALAKNLVVRVDVRY